MIHTAPLDQISFSDIQAFVAEGNREDATLDYKQDWPNDLTKVMAAMANTQGGVILVDVSEKPNDPGLPDVIGGVDNPQGVDQLRQRVNESAYRGIYPPLFPDVEAWELPNAPQKAVVLIRIDQSEQVPHAVDNRSKIYVRVDSLSQPTLYRPAQLDELEWLFERRRKGDEFIATVVEASTARGAAALSSMAGSDIPVLTIRMYPRFYHGGPFFGTREVKTGLASHTKYLNRFESGLCLDLSRILLRIDGFLILAQQLFEGRVRGPLRVQADLENARAVRLRLGPTTWILNARGNGGEHSSPDSKISILDETVDLTSLTGSSTDLVKDAAANLMWAFDYAWDDRQFNEWWHSVWETS
jgi:hypothetical protein